MLDQFSMSRRRFVKTACVVSGAVLTGSSAMAAQGQNISLALLGVAHMHTPMYLQILRTREDVKVKYVWDHDPARAAKVAEACGARVARSAAEAVADAEVAGVVILSETSLHAELALLAAKARKHVFIEKPIGVGGKDAAEIADCRGEGGRPVHNRLSSPHHPKVHLRQTVDRQGRFRQDRSPGVFLLKRLPAPGGIRQRVQVDGRSEVGCLGGLRRYGHARTRHAHVAHGRR